MLGSVRPRFLVCGSSIISVRTVRQAPIEQTASAPVLVSLRCLPVCLIVFKMLRFVLEALHGPACGFISWAPVNPFQSFHWGNMFVPISHRRWCLCNGGICSSLYVLILPFFNKTCLRRVFGFCQCLSAVLKCHDSCLKAYNEDKCGTFPCWCDDRKGNVAYNWLFKTFHVPLKVVLQWFCFTLNCCHPLSHHMLCYTSATRCLLMNYIYKSIKNNWLQDLVIISIS